MGAGNISSKFSWMSARTATMGLRGRKLRLAVTIIATTGFSLFGYDQGLMSGLISGDQFNKEFPPTKGNATIQGAVTACYELGCFFGAIFALMRGDRIGRKPLIVCGALIIIIGTVISTAAIKPYWQTGQFVIGRVITGIGNGMNTATIPVWQSEMSRAENRGLLVNMEGAVVAVGTFLAYWIDFGFSYIDNSVQWRFPVAFQIVFAMILFGGVINLPESPRWLIAHNRKAEAYEILGYLNDCSPDDDQVVAEASAIVDAVNRFANLQTGFKDLFTGGKAQHFQRMIIGSSTQFFQQITGCNAAIYYSTLLFYQTIFNYSKYRLSLILGGVFATIYALATIPSFFLIDTLGRRKLFLIGATGQAISFTISFACLIDDTEQNAKGAAVGIYLFIVFFAFTILPLPWIYPPEINPMRTRTTASAVSTCTNWLMNFAVVMFTPAFIEKSGWGCYLFFACMNYAFIPIIFFFYPETAGRSLEEIDIIFAKAYVDKRQPWRVAATMPKLSLQDIEDEAKNLGLYDDDFEKDNFETKEDISDDSSNPNNGGGMFEKQENVEGDENTPAPESPSSRKLDV
ncbi:sugar transporter-like protein [Lodderomyces elongisporus]|uniref:Sugar transporter STL1 n=1 Tax=Lodderomyces elongisporus (strain ATCC 11503 / CBS 2605 / JCM 1781 / NBRC 1676 / NRRL YB-4239) TaxID=379508 RepID=A5E5R0_LODEL|nr:sugar transporter-like protein [Lodderomyces elongisporus]EDK46768.1 sugar transporter STL1 [Lodderomyces elongisporus NRRL YB-4239]WLF81891.1 sugar transporter-like protein [Lodderomyces elongisporus]